MRNNRIQLILITILSTLVLQYSYPATLSEEECLATGDYLRSDYITEIKKFQSPVDAENEFSFSRVEFGGTYRISVGSWIEGVSMYIQSDCATPVYDNNTIPSAKTFRHINNKSFSVIYEEKVITYEYVGNSASDWIAKTLFEGKWIDDQKQIIQFLENGEAIVNGIKKPYAYDRVLPPDWPDEGGPYTDILEIGEMKYLFKLIVNDLLLFEIDISKPYKEPKIPTFTLRRVK